MIPLLLIYAVDNWKPGFVRPIEMQTKSVSLAAGQIAAPPPHVAKFRGR